MRRERTLWGEGRGVMAVCCYLDTVLVPVQHVVVEYEPPPPEHRALCVQHTIALLVQVACHTHNIEIYRISMLLHR